MFTILDHNVVSYRKAHNKKNISHNRSPCGLQILPRKPRTICVSAQLCVCVFTEAPWKGTWKGEVAVGLPRKDHFLKMCALPVVVYFP